MIEQARVTRAHHHLVVVLVKRANATCISSKVVIKLLFSGQTLARLHLSPLSYCHYRMIFVRLAHGSTFMKNVLHPLVDPVCTSSHHGYKSTPNNLF
jgi:hypothetical protein